MVENVFIYRGFVNLWWLIVKFRGKYMGVGIFRSMYLLVMSGVRD